MPSCCPIDVFERDHPIESACDVRVVRHAQKGDPILPALRFEQIDNERLIGQIDAGCRFVGEHQPWRVRKCSSDCNPLLLSD